MFDADVLRRATQALRVLLIVAAAYAAARAAGAAAAYVLDEGPDPTVAARSSDSDTAPTAVTGPASINYRPIFERNLFGSEPLVETSAPLAGQGAAQGADHGDLLLRGTAQVSDVGYAVFQQKSTGKQDLFNVGEKVFDGPKLVGVQPSRAVILSGGRRITLEVAETDEIPAPAGAKAAATNTDGIRQTGDNEYLVARREVENSIENLSTVITKMRAVPYLKDGKSLGFRVFNIRPNSVFERMGLKNGDVIQNVNGTELRDPQKALSLLDSVASASEISINLLRNQSPTTLRYTIR